MAATVLPAVLNWHSPSHWDSRAKQCQHCPDQTHLRDDEGHPAHKVCAEQAQTAANAAATAAVAAPPAALEEGIR